MKSVLIFELSIISSIGKLNLTTPRGMRIRTTRFKVRIIKMMTLSTVTLDRPSV